MVSSVVFLLDRSFFPSGSEEKKRLLPFFEITLDKLKQFSSEIYVVTSDPEFFSVYHTGIIEEKLSSVFFNEVSERFPDRTLFFINAYAAFVDTKEILKMTEHHYHYSFDYTYPENIPEGLLPDLMQSGIAGLIARSIPKQLEMFRSFPRECFESDLSSYDTNIHIMDNRLVFWRIRLIPDNLQNLCVMEKMLEKKWNELSVSEIEEKIHENPEIIRQRPTYYEIELNGYYEESEQFPGAWCSRDIQPVDSGKLEELISRIEKFSPKAMVSLGLFGEPWLYQDSGKLIDMISRHQNIEFLIESRCLTVPPPSAESFLEFSHVTLLFDLSAADRKSFEKDKKTADGIGAADYDEIVSEIKRLMEKSAKVYLQYTRTSENEEHLYSFFRQWKDFSDRIVVKKPDSFGGEAEKIRSVDLSPVQRFACYHLKHDMTVFSNGDVPLCRQDRNGQKIIGNVFRESLEDIWKKMEVDYLKHWGQSKDLPEICRNCDEWWVFNH